MRKLFNLSVVAILLLATAVLYAEGTRTWTQAKYDDFQKGTTRGVALASDGRLIIAPAFKTLATTPSTYVWSLVTDGKGTIYAAAGSPARVYRIDAAGKLATIFEPKELQVQSLALAADGTLYAATSPDGKVYRLTRKPMPKAEAAAAPGIDASAEPQEETQIKVPVDVSYDSAEFFDPKTKYIWDMNIDAAGNLYIATGDRGEVFKVTRTGESSVFFKSDEAHIRVLSFDLKGNLLAGSDGSGLIYRVSPTGEAFVLYSAAKKEITALAVDAAGNIYAAGVGEKGPVRGLPAGVFNPTPQPTNPQASSTTQTQPAASPQVAPRLGATGGSEIYMISATGAPRRIWSSRDDIVYALGFDAEGRVLAGAGNTGRIFAIQPNGDFIDLVRASASQVTGFTRPVNGEVYVSSSNLGKIYRLGGNYDENAEGVFESDVFDARMFSRWGRAEVRGTGNYEIQARSGNVDNPDRNWSAWQKIDVDGDALINVPPARFLQWKAVLKPGTRAAQVESVTAHYHPANVAPSIEEVVVQTGTKYQSSGNKTADSGQANRDSNPPSQKDPDWVGARWQVRDENEDDLTYSVYYRGDGEQRWKLLRGNLGERFYSWQTTLLPDGGYTLRVVATDAPSNSPQDTLTDERESARFEIDSTAPRVEELNGAIDAGQIHVTFRAVDTFSAIRRAEVSIDAGDWQYVEPVGQISDSKTENYDLTLAAPALGSGPAEHVVVVRVYDAFDNVGSAKVVVRPR